MKLSFTTALALLLAAVHAVAAASSVCFTQLAVPQPTRILCNASIALATPAPLKLGRAHSFEKCRAHCLDDKQCISFGFEAGRGHCQTFGKSLHSMGVKRLEADTGMRFWNHRCFGVRCEDRGGERFTGTTTIFVTSTTTMTFTNPAPTP